MSDFDDDSVYERDFPRETFCAKMEINVDGVWSDCVLINISASGAKLYAGKDMQRGKDVIIKIGDLGEFYATVAWVHGDEMGVKFDHNPDEINQMMIKLESLG